MPQLTEIWTYRGLVGNFAQRELRGKYKGSALGWFWSLLNPLATLAVYALVFGFFLRFPVPVAVACQAFPSHWTVTRTCWGSGTQLSTMTVPRRSPSSGRVATSSNEPGAR